MDFNTKNIQQQYQGFLNTSLLWETILEGLEQLSLPSPPTTLFEGHITQNPRLGKRVESFVSCYLQQCKEVKILKENIQIQNDKITVGEIDCLLLKDHSPVHLEIVYKFYLYDATIGKSELEHWIGPNRKDSLQQKLDKLKNKQLPLLYKKESIPLLKQLNLDINKIQQKVFFKAQLFVPLANQNVVFNQLNSDCVTGFYINHKELKLFSDCKFFIPKKIDWLLEPNSNVDWLSYSYFENQVFEILHQKTAPLCWMKKQNGEISKFFIVWWEPQAL